MQIKNFPQKTTRNEADLILIQDAATGAYMHMTVADFLKDLGSVLTPSEPTFPIPNAFRISASGLSFNDGALIDTVADLSGKGFVCNAAINNKPIFKTNVVNSKPAILFSGNQYFDLQNQPIIPTSSNFVIISVIRPTGFGVIWGGGGQTTNTWGIRQQVDISYVVVGSGLVTGDHVNVEVNTNAIILWGRINNEWIAYKNNGNRVSGGINSGTIRGSSSSYLQRWIIGGMYFDGVPQSFYNGYLFDLTLLINPSANDINSVGKYYADYYSITWVNFG